YSKDMSGKVKSAVRSKCENGEYVFGQVPFGYEKSKTEKNTVVVKESEAKIVRRIFAMAEEGMSSTQIAKKLHEGQVPTSSQMRYPQRKAIKEHYSWSSEMVRKILNNRFYLGEMTYGKTVRKFVGSSTGVLLPREDWKVLPNHHQALITPEVFERVSACRPEQSTKRKHDKHPLTGKIYCGGCGYAINYKPQGKGKMPRHFWCRKHALLQIPECCTYFNAAVLEEIVLNEIYQELMRRGELIKQRESLQKFQKEELCRLGEEKRVRGEEYCRLQKERAALYEYYASGEIGAIEYQKESDKKELQIRELSCKMKEIEEEYDRTEEEYQCPKTNMKQIIRFLGMGQLTQEAVDVFIERVTVYRGKRVEIEWKFGEISINLS
ncbi:MAG: recombinase family protein, partial [Lachnospiraceae bacterium]|nr:recombinase family protein [Lachnospiraceae bacterium]